MDFVEVSNTPSKQIIRFIEPILYSFDFLCRSHANVEQNEISIVTIETTLDAGTKRIEHLSLFAEMFPKFLPRKCPHFVFQKRRTPITLVGCLKANNGNESAMEVRLESAEGPQVMSPSVSIDHFAKQTRLRQTQWARRLADDPDAFAEIEQEIDQHYRQGAGRLVAALLGKVTSQPAMAHQAQRIRGAAAAPLRAPQARLLRVRLLCGLVLFVSTWYCAPRRGKRGTSQPQEQQAGLYPELAALGFGKGCSPALQSTVARIVALSPSIAVARQELARQGIALNKKAVRRIATQLGAQMLALRQRELLAWRAGQLPAGSEFAGRRVAVQIDGGRVCLRENQNRQQKQRRRKGQRDKFHTPWREPKVLTIFEIDERGKMTKKHRQPLIDGTLLGPDHLAELVAYHLHRLGVAQAKLVVFASDGARWIWDRLDWIERRAGLDPSRTVHVLDFCHAAHHVSLALQTLVWDEKQRRETYGRLRWRAVGSARLALVFQNEQSITNTENRKEIATFREGGSASIAVLRSSPSFTGPSRRAPKRSSVCWIFGLAVA